jgi:hypothetical protein
MKTGVPKISLVICVARRLPSEFSRVVIIFIFNRILFWILSKVISLPDESSLKTPRHPFFGAVRSFSMNHGLHSLHLSDLLLKFGLLLHNNNFIVAPDPPLPPRRRKPLFQIGSCHNDHQHVHQIPTTPRRNPGVSLQLLCIAKACSGYCKFHEVFLLKLKYRKMSPPGYYCVTSASYKLTLINFSMQVSHPIPF